jgi:hypothetical protein
MSIGSPPGPPIEPPSDAGDRLIYWIVGGAVLVLCIIGLITYSSHKNTEQAQAKAQELTQAFQKAGLPVPEKQEVFIRTLGTDGGAVCDNPASALGRALLFDQITNGADFVGRRPVTGDRRIIQGQALIMQTYCPDKLQEFRDKFDDLKFDDVLKD